MVDDFVKSATLEVMYNNRQVLPGREYKPSEVVNQPRAIVESGDMRMFYTLVREVQFSLLNSSYIIYRSHSHQLNEDRSKFNCSKY